MTRTVLDMDVKCVKPRGRPKLRYVDTIRRDIEKNELTDVNIIDCKELRMGHIDVEKRTVEWQYPWRPTDVEEPSRREVRLT